MDTPRAVSVWQGTTMQPLVKILRVKTQIEIETTMSLTIVERVTNYGYF